MTSKQLSLLAYSAYSKVGRIQLIKSLKSHLQSGSSFSIQIILCYEFNDAIVGVISDFEFDIQWVILSSCDADGNGNDIINSANTASTDHQVATNVRCCSTDWYVTADAIPATVLSRSVKSDICTMKLKSPSNVGRYLLRIRPINSGGVTRTDRAGAAEAILVVPIMSTEVNVVADITLIPSREVSTLLSNYRIISTSTLPSLSAGNAPAHDNPHRSNCFRDYCLLAREEYMKTLGSHLYDSSVILIEYVRHHEPFLLLPSRHQQCHPYDPLQLKQQRPDSLHYHNVFGSSKFNAGSGKFRVLELGAGCGLAGMFVALMKLNLSTATATTTTTALSKQETAAELGTSAQLPELAVKIEVVITDKLSQKALIESNLLLNNLNNLDGNDAKDNQIRDASAGDECCACTCRYEEFDWSNQVHIDKFRGRQGTAASTDGTHRDKEETPVLYRHQRGNENDAPWDVIVATDVLYDVHTAELFFAVVKQISTPRHTRIIVAQKVRDPVNAPMGLVDVAAIAKVRRTEATKSPTQQLKEEEVIVDCAASSHIPAACSVVDGGSGAGESGIPGIDTNNCVEFINVEMLHREADVIIWLLYTSTGTSSGTATASTS